MSFTLGFLVDMIKSSGKGQYILKLNKKLEAIFRTGGDFCLVADWLAVVLLCYYFVGCLKIKAILKLF